MVLVVVLLLLLPAVASSLLCRGPLSPPGEARGARYLLVSTGPSICTRWCRADQSFHIMSCVKGSAPALQR